MPRWDDMSSKYPEVLRHLCIPRLMAVMPIQSFTMIHTTRGQVNLSKIYIPDYLISVVLIVLHSNLGYYDIQSINSRCHTVCTNWDSLRILAEQRKVAMDVSVKGVLLSTELVNLSTTNKCSFWWHLLANLLIDFFNEELSADPYISVGLSFLTKSTENLIRPDSLRIFPPNVT